MVNSKYVLCRSCGDMTELSVKSKKRTCDECGGEIVRVSATVAEGDRLERAKLTTALWREAMSLKVLVPVVIVFFIIFFSSSISQLIGKSERFQLSRDSGLVIETSGLKSILTEDQRASISRFSAEEFIEFISVFNISTSACTIERRIAESHEKFAEADLIEVLPTPCPDDENEFEVGLTRSGLELLEITELGLENFLRTVSDV